jgi:hypothetical protein
MSLFLAGGIIQGQIVEVHFALIEMIIKGSRIKRNGSVEKPAYLVKSVAGNIALKLHTELGIQPSVYCGLE